MDMKKLTNVLIAVAVFLVAGSASAVPMYVTLNATITADTTGAITLGEPLEIAMVLDTDTPNESAVPGTYLATNLGTTTIFLLGSELVADILSVENGGGIWTLTAEVDLVPLGLTGFLNVAGPIGGTGLTPLQILPDFDTITSGDIIVDLSGILGPEQYATATVGSIDILPVPEPGTALLVGLGLIGLATNRGRRA